MALSLRADVYVCEADGELVFLDLDKDRFSSVDKDCANAFRRLVQGGSTSDADMEALQPLIRYGLLQTRKGAGSAIGCHGPHLCASQLECDRSPVSPWLLGSAIAHQVKMTRALKRHPLHHVIKGFRAKKVKIAHSADPTKIAEIDRLVAAFNPTELIFSAQDRCLRRSLALAHLIVQHGLNASLVIGVRMRPFAAHAWVRWNSVLLNDTIERIAPYSPIFEA